jgi:hypothetical protein
MLEKFKLQKQEAVNQNHVAELINRKDQKKSQKELPKTEQVRNPSNPAP